MTRIIFLALALAAGIGGYLSGSLFGPVGLAVETIVVLSLVVVMKRRWSRKHIGRALRDIGVTLFVVLGATYATAKLGIRHFRDRMMASIDACERVVATVPADLVQRDEYWKKDGLPPPWGSMRAARLRNGEHWVQFFGKWDTARRGLVYYPGNVWIKDSKMGSMHAEKVREGWYLFY